MSDRIHVIHHGRGWKRADNHLDARPCPTCGATVHGDAAQGRHETHHVEQLEGIIRLADRLEELVTVLAQVGVNGASKTVSPPPWTAIDDGSGELTVTYGADYG